MSGISAGQFDHQQRTALLRAKWGWFLLLGVALIAFGIFAVVMPAVSTYAASVILAIALMGAGIVKMIQSLQVREWSGFVWQELTGAVELVGGILIYLYPLKGAIAITLMIALVLFAQGVLQILLAAKIRQETGWNWLLTSGLVALAASAALTLKLPYTRYYTPGTVVGISLLIGGVAYVAIALTLRRTRS